MASRSRTTFKKRQKEIARMEKQREKMAKRMERRILSKQSHDAAQATSGELADVSAGPSGAADEGDPPNT